MERNASCCDDSSVGDSTVHSTRSVRSIRNCPRISRRKRIFFVNTVETQHSTNYHRYDLYKQSSTYQNATFPGTRIFLRAFDGTFVQPCLRKVISRQDKRSFLQRWTVSAGYRRREKHSTYIICSGEEIMLRSHQGRYLSSNGDGCPTSTSGVRTGMKPDTRLWWRIVRHNENKCRSSTDFVRSF